jgi:hypothetical protein
MSHLIPLFRRLTEAGPPTSSVASVEGDSLHGGTSGDMAVQPLESVSTHGDQVAEFHDYNDDDVYGDDAGGHKQGSGLVRGFPVVWRL